MKFIILVALIVVANADLLPEDLSELDWNNFKREFGKTYAVYVEDRARKAIFEENLKRIHDHNVRASNGLHSYRLGVNQFADMTNDEFVRKMNGLRVPPNRVQRNVHTDEDVSALPATVDWRTKGVVTEVKNQGFCGSCWAFSAVASIEGQHALSTKTLVSLSEQNLVDCSTAEGNQGCNGGLMDQAFEYVIKNNGIDTESSYSYEGYDESCAYKTQSSGATVTNFTDITTGSESALQNAVANVGPISVAIDASQFSFQLYTSGVYDEPNCGNKMENLDHGVTAVGYGTEDGADYWLVKNSWGSAWGESGYIKMSRNKDNQCGISTAASYPTGVH